METGTHCGILKEPSGDVTETHQPILSAPREPVEAFRAARAGRVLTTCLTSLPLSVLTGDSQSLQPCLLLSITR